MSIALAILTVIALIAAIFLIAKEIERMRSIRLDQVRAIPIAPDEWHRIRRLPRHTPIKVWIAISLFAGVLLGDLVHDLLTNPFGANRDEMVADFLSFAFWFSILFLVLGAGAPAVMLDCLANQHQIIYREFGQERVFERSKSRIKLRRSQFGICPFVAQLRTGSQMREVALDEHGAATLRALGWIKNEDSP